MFKKKVFVVFEGIEGSGKSAHSRYLSRKLKKNKIPHIYLREPGGSPNAEQIRKILLKKENNKFHPFTDLLLYLASRNENFIENIMPFYRKKVIICDRFIDSTLAYQHYGLGIKKNIINVMNKEILGSIKPDFTFLMDINVNKSLLRISSRKKKNRYDKFTKTFYRKVKNGFLKIYQKNKSKYMIIDTSLKFKVNQKLIFDKLINLMK